jgi:hypothetical protein
MMLFLLMLFLMLIGGLLPPEVCKRWCGAFLLTARDGDAFNPFHPSR